MPRARCSVCQHAERALVDARLSAGDGPKAIQRDLPSLSHQAIQRHRDRGHVRRGQVIPPQSDGRRGRTVDRLPLPNEPPKVPQVVAELRTREQRAVYVRDLLAAGFWRDHETPFALHAAWPDLTLAEILTIATDAAFWVQFARGPVVFRRIIRLHETEELKAQALAGGDVKTALACQREIHRIEAIVEDSDRFGLPKDSAAWRAIVRVLHEKHPAALGDIMQSLAANDTRVRAALAIVDVEPERSGSEGH